MAALKNWHPIPLISQPIFQSTKRKYQQMRLKEQLDNAFAGGVNPFAVTGWGVQKFDEGHPALGTIDLGMEDAPGEIDFAVQTGRRPSSGVGLQTPGLQRKPSLPKAQTPTSTQVHTPAPTPAQA
jgi:hypothetical protein